MIEAEISTNLPHILLIPNIVPFDQQVARSDTSTPGY